MFNVSTLLLHYAFKPATPLATGVINETLRQFCQLSNISQSVATHLRCGVLTVKQFRQEALLWQRDQATCLSVQKSLQTINDLEIHPRSSQLLLLNDRTAYHFLFVDCCFNVFIYRTVFKTLPLLMWTRLPVTLRTPSFLTTKLKLQATCTF